MGFQFNSVGGGTKTRCPITLHMKYNAACAVPRCFLLSEDLVERELGLEQLQAFIEAENGRLEAQHSFSAKEIITRIEYRFCPNLTIIDTPGALHVCAPVVCWRAGACRLPLSHDHLLAKYSVHASRQPARRPCLTIMGTLGEFRHPS
eukprot:364320-Chlamydomonas_euryale.AAC.13